MSETAAKMNPEGIVFRSYDDMPYRPFFVTFALSLACHMLIGAGLIYLTGRISTHMYIPSAISVSVVSFPDELPGAGTPDVGTVPVEEPPDPAVPEPEIPEEAPLPVPENPEPEKIVETVPDPKVPEETVVIPEAKKTPDVKTEPAEKPKEKPPEPVKPKEKNKPVLKPGERPKSVTDAINQIRKQLRSEESGKSSGPITGTGTGIIGNSTGSGSIYGNFDSAAITFYRQNILRDWIQRNWVFPEHLVGKDIQLKTILLVKIMSDGNVADIRYEKKSGNSYLDESAYRAVAKSHPFPPLPKGFTESYYIVAVGFTPKGLE